MKRLGVAAFGLTALFFVAASLYPALGRELSDFGMPQPKPEDFAGLFSEVIPKTVALVITDKILKAGINSPEFILNIANPTVLIILWVFIDLLFKISFKMLNLKFNRLRISIFIMIIILVDLCLFILNKFFALGFDMYFILLESFMGLILYSFFVLFVGGIVVEVIRFFRSN